MIALPVIPYYLILWLIKRSPHWVNVYDRHYFLEDIRINSMNVRDICPYSSGTIAHRLSSKNEIQSF